MEISEHWLSAARVECSPNFNERPNQEISVLVIHNISLPPGCFSGDAVIDLFLNRLDWDQHPFYQQIRGLEVSSHLLIRRDGELIQFVPFDKRAWHAGRSSFDGRENCNDFSIGIELEGSDDCEFTAAQYQALVTVTKALMHAYPQITAARVTGHSDIAPGRKTDPGPCFNWAWYRSQLIDAS